MRLLWKMGLILFSLATGTLLAQLPTASTGVVMGTVVDQTGGAIPGAEVTLIDVSTDRTRIDISDDSGHYAFGNVLPGTYRVEVSMTGFSKAVVSDLKVEVTKSYTIDVTLELGEISDTINVVAGVGAELQKTDSTIGNTLTDESIMKLPNVTRDVHSIQFIQPLSVPYQGADASRTSSGSFAGARTDQNSYMLDGVDVSDTVVGNSFGAPLPSAAVPLPNESVEEFRVGATNPNATFGRSSGAQLSVVTKRGTNRFHGSAYWYHQNDNFNANTWTRNRTGLGKPELKDNRFGFSIGGPLWKDKTFFFVNYEGRRFPETTDISRIVPTETLRQGILRFRDADGNVNSYNLFDFDPRGIGMNPLVESLWSHLPAGNNPSLGDGLNTIGFTASPGTSTDNDFGVLRIDHNFSQKWRLDGSFRYSSETAFKAGQVDIGGILPGNTPGVAAATEEWPREPRFAVAGLTGEIRPNFINEFRVAWLRDFLGFFRATPFPQIPQATMAFDVAGGLIDEPLDVTTGRSRSQSINSRLWQFIDNATWIKGNHSILFGGSYRNIWLFHPRNDKVVGSLTALVAELNDGNFLSIPSSARPPTCGTEITSACLRSGDVTRWNQLYSGLLGLIDNTNVLIVRDGSLNPLPIGTEQEMEASSHYFEWYVNDTWRITPNFTLNLGATYSVQLPPTEIEDRFTFLTNNESGNIINSEAYLDQVEQGALQGNVFGPTLSYTPLRDSGRERINEIDWSNFGPRAAVAWSPSYDQGWLGKLFGDRRTVIRAGYSKVFDRVNTVQSVLLPALGVAFAQTVNVPLPLCDHQGTPGPGCNTAGGTAAGGFRIGIDGDAPAPGVPAVTSPVVPGIPFGELISFQVDPDVKIGRTHSVNFTIQRQMPGDMIFETGWVGRFARDLTQNRNLNAAPFFFVDSDSGQPFAEAFDFVAEQLRSGIDPADVTAQPWFENQLGAGFTQSLAGSNGSDFIVGNVSSLFLNINLIRAFGLGLSPYNNLQVLENWVRGDGGKSYYSGAFFTLKKRFTQGLTFDFNYTISQALDQVGRPQNTVTAFSSPFLPDLDYGPAAFDRRHVVTSLWLYELPFGTNRRFSTTNSVLNSLFGGWNFSGIFTANSGLPMDACQSSGAFGGGNIFTVCSGAIPVGDLDFDNSVHQGVAGSGGVGSAGDPAAGGTGLNLYSNPEAVLNSFRPIRISEDRRVGRGVLRGLPRWSLDFSFGKRTAVAEQVEMVISLDIFNAFNNVQFDNPSLNLSSPATFGVLTSQGNTPRSIQLGLRVEF